MKYIGFVRFYGNYPHQNLKNEKMLLLPIIIAEERQIDWVLGDIFIFSPLMIMILYTKSHHSVDKVMAEEQRL